MSVRQLTEHHLELLSLKGDCTGLSESTLVKMSHCWKSHDCHDSYTMMVKVNLFLSLTICMPGNFTYFLSSADYFFQINFFKSFQEHIPCQMVCKGYQQMTKVAINKERVKLLIKFAAQQAFK